MATTDAPRAEYAGPESGPETPFPIKLRGPVIKGFGRGSKELGIPTANIPPSGLDAYPSLDTGIYFGYTSLLPPSSSSSSSSGSTTTTTTATTITTATDTDTDTDTNTNQTSLLPLPPPPPPPTPVFASKIYPCVLSIGYNPFYGNTTRSVEIHVLHSFSSGFYGWSINLLILGYIRPERGYDSVDALIKDIKIDCEVAGRSLAREAWKVDGRGREAWRAWLRDFNWAAGLSEEVIERVQRSVLGGGLGGADEDGNGDGASEA